MSFIKTYKGILIFYIFILFFSIFTVWRFERLDSNTNYNNNVVFLK